jgi:hypothetical protein
MLVLQNFIRDVWSTIASLDPGIALIIFVLTLALDGLHIVYTRQVIARRAVAAANSGAITYLIYAFAIIESTHNWSYIAIMAAGSWVGTYLALRFVPIAHEAHATVTHETVPQEALRPAMVPPRPELVPVSGDVRDVVRASGRVDGLGGMRHHVGDDAADMRIGGGVEDLLALPLRAQHAGRAQQAKVMTDEGLRKLGAARDVRDAGRDIETGGMILRRLASPIRRNISASAKVSPSVIERAAIDKALPTVLYIPKI